MGLEFFACSHTRFQIQPSPDSDLKSFGHLIMSQEFGKLPELGEFVTESQSRVAPSHESRFQLGTDCKFLPSQWCFGCLGAGLSVGSHQSSRRESRGAGAFQHPAREPQSQKTTTFWRSTKPCLDLQRLINKNTKLQCAFTLKHRKHLFFFFKI